MQTEGRKYNWWVSQGKASHDIKLLNPEDESADHQSSIWCWCVTMEIWFTLFRIVLDNDGCMHTRYFIMLSLIMFFLIFFFYLSLFGAV